MTKVRGSKEIYLKTLSYLIIVQNCLVLLESPLPSMMAQEVLKQLFADRAKLFNQVSKYLCSRAKGRSENLGVPVVI